MKQKWGYKKNKLQNVLLKLFTKMEVNENSSNRKKPKGVKVIISEDKKGRA